MLASTMATMDKLMKALEALKVSQPTSSADDSVIQKKKDISPNAKEKILYCSTVADAICSPQLRLTSDFPKVLGLAMDTFLICCDDENSDVRLMADECLNRTIKTLLDSHLGRLLVELFKEIKKDGSARSLRAALSRFGDICHLMRPQKCRPYTVNLVPALAKICQRNHEESVQETLAIAMTKIMPVLGQFTNDKDIKVLLKGFLPNLIVNSAIVRRSAATSITCICQHSRRPSSFFSWILSALFELILPAQEERPVYIILGVLLCLRHLVPHLSDAMPSSIKGNVSIMQNEEEMNVTKEQILKIYEITLHFAHHPDHNVITATLETLFQLLKCAPKVLQSALVSSLGITKSLIYVSDMPKLNRSISESQSSVLPSSTSVDESALEDDQDIYIPEKKDDSLSYFEGDVRISVSASGDGPVSCDSGSGEPMFHPSMKFQLAGGDYFHSETSGVNIDDTPKRVPFLKKGASDESILDTDDEFWEHSSSTPSPGAVSKTEFKVGNIGTFTDADVPLKYCVRLLCSSFLLNGTPGSCISDRNVRISVKSLALGCLSSIFSLYPSGIFLTLHAVPENGGENLSDEQRVWDVTLYASHSDPHIRGQASVMIGHLLGHALREAGGCWLKWTSSHEVTGAPSLQSLLSQLICIVQDESSVASKLGLVGLKQCLQILLNSCNALESFCLLETLLHVKDNSYWLYKVELAEVISSIPFKVVYYLERNRTFGSPLRNTFYQDKILNEVLLPLLGDEDFRVRQASAAALVRLVPKLFFPIDHPNKDPVTAVAKESTDIYLDIACKSSLHSTLPLVHALVKPFAVHSSVSFNPLVDASLSRVINLLVTTLRMCTNKYLIYGCCHTLCLLSEEFLVTVFCDTWSTVFSDVKSETASSEDFRQHAQVPVSVLPEAGANPSTVEMCDLLCHLVSLVTNTSLCLDLVAHQHVLQLTGNLLCGAWYKLFLEAHKNSSCNQQDMKLDAYVSSLVAKLFLHLMRLLNVYTHVLEEQYPVSVSNRPALPSLPNAPSLSPIKRKNKTKEETSSPSISSAKGSPNRGIDKGDGDKERSGSKINSALGQFHSFPLYMKLFEILRGAYGSYKISMDFQSSEKFCQLLKCALDVMSQLLEVSESQEMGKNAEEMLCYLKSLMTMEPCSSVQCVRQLLKCLFGTNLITLCQEAQLVFGLCKKYNSSNKLTSTVPGLYHTVISHPYTDFNHSLANKIIKGLSSDENDDLVSFRCLNWVKRGNDKLNTLLKSGSKGEKANLAAHIRLFEGVVIRALQQYTISSDIALQCQVLDLLAQLVQLRVNYCLLDADQIFIGYVIKQLEFIEEGQIINADILIPRIFYFLILLSYERYHSKPIISVSKILQLCDNLISSGQPPDKYVVRALQPVIEDLFLIRSMNKMDIGKELDAQREVITSTLFKLVYYPQVLDLFFLIVTHSRQEGDDKWRKTSREVVDIILPLLSRQQIQIENQAQLNILQKLLEAVAPNVFRPVDILLKALFSQPKDLKIPSNIHRWLCMVLTVLRVLISQANEEAVLSRLADMGITVKIYKLGLSPTFRCEKEQCESFLTDNNEMSPGTIFARFLFQVTGIIVESLCNNIFSPSLEHAENTFLCQEAAHLLLYLTYMFQSGTFRRVTTSAMSIIKETVYSEEQSGKYSVYYSIAEIENMFLKLASSFPVLVIQWCNILTLLNCDNRSFWSKIIQPCHEFSGDEQSFVSVQAPQHKRGFLPCNLEMVHRGGIILLCDYVCENPTDVVQMTWLVVHHVNDIINLSLETTVQDFIGAIHRNPAASGLWIQAMISAQPEDLSKPSFWKQALNCLENIHITQSGKLLSFLVDNLLSTHHLLVANICDRLACKRLENLLSEPAANQLTLQDIDGLINGIRSLGIKRYEDLLLLCEKLKTLLSNEVSPTSAHPLIQPSIQIQDTELNKDWYIKFVQEECFTLRSPAKECARLLSRLKYNDIRGIMTSKDFQLPILEQCLSYGAFLITSSEKANLTRSDNPFVNVTESPGSALYRAAEVTLLQHLTDFMTIIPRSEKIQSRLEKLLTDETFWELFLVIVPTTSCYLKTLSSIPGKNISADSVEDIALLSIVCCEAMIFVIKSGKTVSLEMLRLTLLILDKTLKNTELSSGLQSSASWIFSTISAIHFLVNYLQQDKSYVSLVFPLLENNSLTHDQDRALKSCIKMAELIEWLEKSKQFQMQLSECIFRLLKSIIKGMARWPLVNSFARTPPILWQLGWSPEFSGDFKTVVPPPPGEYLQDRDVLKQYIYRINLLGWISRQQFEETWMALLGVLSATPIDDIDGKEEDQERIRTSCLAVKSITSLLLQTLLYPQPGNPQSSFFLIHPRDKPLAFQHTKCGKKLKSVTLPIHTALQNLLRFEKNEEKIMNVNAEKVATPYPYSLSQVSLEYLNSATSFVEDTEDLDGSTSSNSSPVSTNVGGISSFQQREQCLSAFGLDIHSCLHFLLDLYSQWLSPQSCPFTPLTLLKEVAKSVIALSDTFMEKAQFEWMLDTFLEVQRIHPAEDEIIAQYLIFGICKAVAVLGIEQDVLDKLRKLLELSLKSTYLPTRIYTLHGLLYLLQQGVGDESFPLLPTATEYIQKNLDMADLVKSKNQNEDHTLIMWIVAFYIIENYQDEISDDFSQKVYEVSLSLCGHCDESATDMVYLTVLNGLERLLVAEILTGKEANLLLKLSVDRLRSGTPVFSLAALELFLSCMYMGKSTNMWSNELVPDNSKALEKSHSSGKQLDSEFLLVAMERVTTLFDRIKKSYPFEAQVICEILPAFLMEFFPVQEILNKIITEFLSSQQPHPQFMAKIIFEVFQCLHKQSQEEIIHEWVLLSLSNFMQRSPLSMAIWSLNCFFVSATTNYWFQSLFPYVQNRMGKMEEQDKLLFCVAGVNFRDQLQTDDQKQAYLNTIRSVALPQTPYADLLRCLQLN